MSNPTSPPHPPPQEKGENITNEAQVQEHYTTTANITQVTQLKSSNVKLWFL